MSKGGGLGLEAFALSVGKRLPKILSGLSIVAVLSILLLYQNCADNPGAVTEASEEAVNTFAYSAKIDTLAYMSCANMNEADPSAYFTFRMGAYAAGGLSLNSDFLAQARALSPTLSNLPQLVTSNELNRDLRLQCSLRRESDMVVFATQQTPQENRDFQNFFPVLSDTAVINRLTATTTSSVRAVPSDLTDGRFECSMGFHSAPEATAAGIRSEMRQTALLALTFHPGEASDATVALGPGDFTEQPTNGTLNTAYGTGLEVSFKQGATGVGNAPRVLASVREVDLLTKNEVTANWQCPAELILRIVRPLDADALTGTGEPYVNCDRVTDPPVLSADMEKIRRVLRVEDWYVDFANKCAIPKPGVIGSCYGPDTDIEYANLACGGGKVCSHFISVCLR